VEADRATTFGEALRRHRAAAGMTQEELAERAGMSVRGLSYLEKDGRQPYRDTVRRLADALGLDESARVAFTTLARQAGGESADPDDEPPVRRVAPVRREPLPPLVGRVQEVALLERHLDGFGPPLLVLAGEPGIGKSRLLREAADRAEERGWCVLQGGCQRRNGQAPFAPLLEALDGYIARRSTPELRADLRGCAWLVRLLPELAGGPIEPLTVWTLPPEQERRLMDKAVGRFLANVAGSAGTLLVLDDLQWASADALELLATLVRAAEGPPLRVIGAYRDTEVQAPDPLAMALADLAQAGLAAQRPLAPLSAPEVGQLLGVLLEDGAGDRAELEARVAQRTGGVPFFVVSCAQLLRLGGGGEGDVEAVPWDVAQGIRQRVAVLPAGTREVLSVAAVIGRVVRPSLLIDASEQDEHAVLAALEVADRARLLVEEDDRYQFAHDLIREVLEGEVGAARRTVLHRRIAEALEREPGEAPVELLAYHYARAGEQDRAVLYLERAGDKAGSQHANDMAKSYYRDVVDRLDRLGRVKDAAPVREKLGTLLYTEAHFEAALEVLEQAAATYQAVGAMEDLRRTLARIGRLHTSRLTSQEGLARIQPLLPSLEGDGPSAGLAELYAALGELSGSEVDRLTAAERAAAVARAAHDDWSLVDPEQQRGVALFWLGHVEESISALEGAIELAEAAGHGRMLWSLWSAFIILAMIHDNWGEFDRSGQYAERALAIGEQAGNRPEIATALAFRCLLAFHAGDWAQARADGERAVAISRQIGPSWANEHSFAWLAHLCLAEGKWDEAARYLEEGGGASHYTGPRLEWGLAELDLRAGRPDAARARLEPAVEFHKVEPHFEALFLPVLAEAHLGLGAVAEAERVCADAITRAQAAQMRTVVVDALRVQARAAMAQGCWPEAQRSLEEGLELARGMGYPYAEGRLLHAYGELHLRRCEPAAAREQLEAALAIFRRLGARKDAERAEQAIARPS
jgi:transcriptional regulator with XRE-family HTH domain/tetratricopeptide (TPR) repeat protein